MARTQQDDAAAMKEYVDPLIRDAVATGLMGAACSRRQRSPT